MRIAIVASYDVTNINNWSGTPYYLLEFLKKHFTVTPVEVSLSRPAVSWIRSFYYNRIQHKTYFSSFDPDVYSHSKSLLDAQFKDGYDVIITYDYFLIPAIAKYAKHTILITDATFDNLLNYYDYRTNLCSVNVKYGHKLQKQAFEKLSMAFFSSQWAIGNAQDVYGARPDQLKKLMYGSNLSRSLNGNEIETVVNDRLKTKEIYLFFPVVYWERKGGEYVMDIIARLKERGHPAKLVVAGRVPEGIESDDIINLGYLDKSDPAQEKTMLDYYRQSHFLIMPSKADCTPIVFCEANSFALPVISTKTGGIESMINPENDNGVTYQLDDSYVDNVADYIISTLQNEVRYREICQNAFRVFQEQFDWSVAQKTLVDYINSLEKETARVSD